MNIFIIAILGIVVFLGIMFVVFSGGPDGIIKIPPLEKPAHYEFEFSGLKESYLVNEQVDVSLHVSGYGSLCGELYLYFQKDGKITGSPNGRALDCTGNSSYELDSKYTGIEINNRFNETGTYSVVATFNPSVGKSDYPKIQNFTVTDSQPEPKI